MKVSSATSVVSLFLILSLAHGSNFRLRGASGVRPMASQDHPHLTVAQQLLTLAKSSSDPSSHHAVEADTDADLWVQRNKKNVNSTIEIRTITILHGVNATLFGDAADNFAECYMTSYNSAAQIFHGNAVESMQEDAQFVVDAATTNNDDQHLLVVPHFIKAALAPRTTTKSVVYVGKIRLGSQCRLCGDDRLQEENQDVKKEGNQEETDLALEESKRQQRRQLVYSAFRKGFFQCLTNSGNPSFNQLVKLEVRKLTSPTIVGTASRVTHEAPRVNAM